ncbi:MAG TPA: hypothetical protein VHD56_01875 [Tepidisphaeraceae bacterium]|nr:hypothetical protein [Tepidisphaeraceae bacterium]
MPINSPVLVLTATINPKGMIDLKLHDIDQRRSQYLQALRFWLHLHDDQVRSIVFAENSGSDLTSFQNIVDSENPHGKSVELISLNQNDFPRQLGKGYGEFMLLDSVLQQSKALATAEHFIKITGRLVVTNLPKMIRCLPARYDLVCDAFLVSSDPNGGRIDSRLMFVSRSFYERAVLGAFHRMNDSVGIFAEHVFFELMQEQRDTALFTRLPIEPRWRGVSGSTGADYTGTPSRIKWPLKAGRRMWHRLVGYPSIDSIRAARRKA